MRGRLQKIMIIFFLLTPICSLSVDAATFRDAILFITSLSFYVVLVGREEIKFNRTWIYSMFFSSIYIISSFLSKQLLDRGILTFLLFNLVYLFTIGVDWEIDSLIFGVKSLLVLSIFIIVLIFIGWFQNIPFSWGRYSLDAIGLHRNPNYITPLLVLNFSYVMRMLKKERSLKSNIFYILVGVATFFAISMTGTRSSFLVFVIVFLISVLNENWIKNNISFLLFLGAIFIFVLKYYDWDIASKFARVLYLKNYSDSSRLEAWSWLLANAQDSLLLGKGINGSTSLLSSTNYITHPHNIFLELIIDHGIVGFSFYLMMLYSNRDKNFHISHSFDFTFMIAVFMPLYFINGLIAIPFWWSTILFSMHLKYKNKVLFDRRGFN